MVFRRDFLSVLMSLLYKITRCLYNSPESRVCIPGLSVCHQDFKSGPGKFFGHGQGLILCFELADPDPMIFLGGGFHGGHVDVFKPFRNWAASCWAFASSVNEPT